MSSSNPQNNDSPSKGVIDNLINILQKFFNFLSIITLTTMILVVFYQVFARFALPKSPNWTEELSRFLFVYLIVFTSGSAIIMRRHISLDTIRDRLKPKGKLIFDTFCHLIIAIFCGYLLKYAWIFVCNGAKQKSPAMGIQMNWIYSSTLVFFGLVLLTTILLILKDFKEIFSKDKA